eukprot:g29262.t1
MAPSPMSPAKTRRACRFLAFTSAAVALLHLAKVRGPRSITITRLGFRYAGWSGSRCLCFSHTLKSTWQCTRSERMEPLLAGMPPPTWDEGFSSMTWEASIQGSTAATSGAASAAAGQTAVFVDFSQKDGGCDIRFPAGATFEAVEQFEWWGWGAGSGSPVGSGLQKHDSETRCYLKTFKTPARPKKPELSAQLHPKYQSLIREYPFQPVRNERGKFVNVILVRSPFRSSHQEQLYEKFKDEAWMPWSHEWSHDYPLPAPNPFSSSFPREKYLGLFPGFLYMHRDAEPRRWMEETLFPSHVKLLLLSQSDFSLPGPVPALPKKYDFTFSGSDQDVAQDRGQSFVKEALEVMCGELQMTGVLVATKDKQGRKACRIPSSCNGLITQTTFLSQDERQSHFLFLPQVHDASPRVITQALALDVPVLMNKNIIGGWKYLTPTTGEGFNDIHDLKQSIEKLRAGLASKAYAPRRYVDENCGDQISGSRLRHFVETNFGDRVKLPEGTKLLFPSGA